MDGGGRKFNLFKLSKLPKFPTPNIVNMINIHYIYLFLKTTTLVQKIKCILSRHNLSKLPNFLISIRGDDGGRRGTPEVNMRIPFGKMCNFVI